MPTTPEPSAAQEILSVVSVGLLAVGGAAVASGLGMLKRRRGRKPSEPSTSHFAIGVAMVLGGAVAMAFRHDPAPEPEAITPERFSAIAMPAVSVDAPPPWRFEHDLQKGRLVATRPGGKLMIETSFISDANDRTAALAGVFGGLQRMGLEPAGEPFMQWFDGIEAAGRVGAAGVGSSAIWVAERPGKLFTVIVCTSETGHDALTACHPILSTLKWRPPGPR